jgi:hypothetical protein
MSENEEAKPAEQDTGGIVLDLNFAPSWARTSPDAPIQRYQDNRFDNGEEGDGRHGGREGGRDRRPPRRDFGDSRNRTDRKPRREFEQRGPRTDMPRPESRGAVADLRVSRPEGGGARPDRGERYERRDFRPARPEQPPIPLEIRVLPEQKALGAVIRRIQTSHRAFPLRDIAWLFLDNPASCLIRIEPLKDQQVPLFQCKVCGLPALTEEEVRAHLVNRHMDDFFDVEEVSCDPPSGAFVCVARCSLSGELLGPPNHHSFNSKVHEMLRTRFPNMSEEAYRSRIETVRESEVIEQWRQQCTKKKIYRRKGATLPVAEPVADGADVLAEGAEAEPPPKAPPMEREVAELVFMREILPEQISNVRHLICTAAVAVQTTSRPLYFALKDTLNRERRFPASLFFALRGAFRHRNLHLFRVNDPKGQDFVMLKAPALLDPTHTVQALRDVLTYVTEHGACTKSELVTALAGSDETKIKETLVQLVWLVEKGHVIEYYNDVLSAPLDYPAFRFLSGEKQQQGGQQQGGRRPEVMTPPVAQPEAADTPAVPAEPDGAPAEAAVPAEAAEEVPVVVQPAAADTPAAPAEPDGAPAEAAVPAEAPAAATEEVPPVVTKPVPSE